MRATDLTRHGRCTVTAGTGEPVRTVQVAGRLDWAGVEQLRPVLDAAPDAGGLVLDLREVTSLDAAGTGMVLARLARMQRGGRPVAVVAGHPAVHHVLSSAGRGSAVPLCTDLDEARRLVSAPVAATGVVAR